MNRLNRLILSLLALCTPVAYGGSLWHVREYTNSPQQRAATHTLVYSLDENDLKAELSALNITGIPQTLELPMPDGTFRTFRIWANNLMPAELAARYPEIKTYTAEATDNKSVTAKIDITPLGFHAMVFDGNNTSFINPADRVTNTGDYTVTYKRDEPLRTEDRKGCITIPAVTGQATQHTTTAQRTENGRYLLTYRIAIGCDHQYTQAATGVPSPTKAGVLSYIVTTLNRVNGVYERELSITMTLTPHEDTLIFLNDATDPYGAHDSDPYGLMTINQKMCDSLIGTTNYDVGHIFSTGAGGLSSVGCVCNTSNKAQSVTGNSSPTGDGFDIDYVAHEIGHEFGGEHTFNNNVSGSCSGNSNQPTAYEPGSGSTIMAYAGICGGDNIQQHSDAYFTTISLLQINSFVTGTGGGCGVKTLTGNAPPALDRYTATYNIPYQTPFELTAPKVTDSVADTSNTYCWEQWNLGDWEKTLNTTDYAGPLFRSYSPDTGRTRIFPHIAMVLAGIKSNAGINNAEGEKLPAVARYLTFRLTTRSILNGNGYFMFPDDSIHLDVANTGRGFTVTSQNTADIKYIGTSMQTVTWDVANTIGAPINTANVDIYLSTDGGYTWPYNLGNFPNTGSAVITLPNPTATTNNARIKVKGSGNVFFNINAYDFSIINNPGLSGDILLFPVPAKNTVTVVTGDKGNVVTTIYNSIGRLAWKGEINGIASLDVAMWPRDVYIIRMTDVNKKVYVKKFVLE